ncbi:MAG: hypothetical protein ACKODX_04005 [Gemmata sp.]
MYARRARRQRNLFATLPLSQGADVLTGDEFGHMQGGSYNAYYPDHEAT